MLLTTGCLVASPFSATETAGNRLATRESSLTGGLNRSILYDTDKKAFLCRKISPTVCTVHHESLLGGTATLDQLTYEGLGAQCLAHSFCLFPPEKVMKMGLEALPSS